MRLRHQGQVMVLPPPRRVLQVRPVRNHQPRIPVIILSPQQVISVPSVFLQPNCSRFIRIVPQTLRRQHKLIQPLALAGLRIRRERTPQQPNAVAKIHITLVLPPVPAHRRETIPQFPVLANIEAALVRAPRRTHFFINRGSHRLLRRQQGREQPYKISQSPHRRNLASLFEP